MEMKKINSGKLRAVGYDARARLLQVQLDDGNENLGATLAKEVARFGGAVDNMVPPPVARALRERAEVHPG